MPSGNEDEAAEDIVVAGRRLVPADHDAAVNEDRCRVVNATPDALAGDAAGARRASVGTIARNVGVADRGGGRAKAVEQATAQAVAPVAADASGPAIGAIGADIAVGQRQRAF